MIELSPSSDFVEEVHFLSEHVLMTVRFVNGQLVGATGCNVKGKRIDNELAVMSRSGFEDVVVLNGNLKWIGREVNWVDDYDNWKTSPPEDKRPVVAQCAHKDCPDADIKVGDDIYITDQGDQVHADCWDDYAKEELNATRTIAADPRD